MRLLLLSNSTLAGQPYLGWATAHLHDFFGPEVKRLAFAPFAAVRFSYDEYVARVQAVLGDGIEVVGLHEGKGVLDSADAVAVGGGNTFHLLRALYQTALLDRIEVAVRGGMPYAGWSAGANVAGPSVRTTNDMPIVEPPSLSALNLVPFQINPHYTDAHPPGHQGETRRERIAEFVTANPGVPVVGLPEGTALRREGSRLDLVGEHAAYLFHGVDPVATPAHADLSSLLNRSSDA